MTRFALLLLEFDDDLGPSLVNVLTHELPVREEILETAAAAVMTLAAGIGEPSGRSETAVIPLSLSQLSGTMLVHSFGVPDDNVRGGLRMESFMLFLSEEDREKLLMHSLQISDILENAARTLRRKGIKDIGLPFEDIRKLLITEIDRELNGRYSAICTEKESSVISDGAIRAIHNVIVKPQLVEDLGELHRLCTLLLPFITGTTIEVHGKTSKLRQLFMLSLENTISITFTTERGRIGEISRPIRDLLWEFSLKSDQKSLLFDQIQ